MIISLGTYLNHLGRPNVVTAVNPAANRKFPVPNLYNQNPASYMLYGAVPTSGIDGGTLNRVGVTDLSLLRNPGAELGIVGWKKGGTVVATAAQFHGGAKSWQIAANGYLYQDVFMRSGEKARISCATMGDGASAEGYFGILNINTGNTLLADGTWGVGDQEVGTGTSRVALIKKLGAQTTAAWLETAIQFSVEPYEQTLNHLTTLRIVAACGGAGNAFVDDLVLIPATDWCSLHGFNFPANMTVGVASSDTGVFGGEQVNRFLMNPFQPSFNERLDSVFYARYLKWTLLGIRERTFAPFIGELIFTQAVHLEISSRYGSAMSAAWTDLGAGVRNAKQAAKVRAQPLLPTRAVNLPFRWFEETHWTQAREWFINRCRNEQEYVLIAAPEFDERIVIYGIIKGSRGFALISPDARDSEPITITELQLPWPG